MNKSFSSVVTKATVVHTVTYFLVGLLAFVGLGYTAKYADPVVSHLMRQTSDPWVAAGPVFQLLRGFLFGIVFYALYDAIFPKKRGWLTLWLVLVIVGIVSPFGPSPSSIEGVLYTILPMWFHVAGLPEVLVQSALLAFVTHYWVNHPEQKWLAWVLWILLGLVVLFSGLGLLAALGVLPRAG